ncbi:MAG: hypothetical protein HY720_32135 [Planctomycetes bacterium]|nr:hypothetical protein [Planctomycetota bacterium]
MDPAPRMFRASDALVAAWTLVLLAFALMPLMTLQNSELGENRAKCRSNLNQIGKALFLYAEKNNDLLPDADGIEFLSRLYETQTLEDPNVYLCPSWDDSIPATSNRLTLESCDYSGLRNTDEALRLTPARIARDGSRQAVSADRRPSHHDDVRNVLFADGHADSVEEEGYLRVHAGSLGE